MSTVRLPFPSFCLLGVALAAGCAPEDGALKGPAAADGVAADDPVEEALARFGTGPSHDGEGQVVDLDNVRITKRASVRADLGQDEVTVATDSGEVTLSVPDEDLENSCIAALSADGAAPSGRSLIPCGDESWISPDAHFNTTGSFELRVVARPDDRYDGTYLSLASAGERLEIDREQDSIQVSYSAYVRDSGGYGEGQYLSGTLVAPLARSGGVPLTQEVRVGVSGDGLTLAVDGIVYASLVYDLDFSGLTDGGVALGATPLAAFDSIGFFPGAPAAGAVWSTPCDSDHAGRGSWCVNFDGVSVDALDDGDMVAEPTGIFTVGGEFQLFGG